MIEAIIFDLDGTIINTEDMWAQATKQMLITRGINYSDALKNEIHNQVHGLPPLKACAIVKEMLQLQDSVHILAEEKARRARTLFSGNIRLIDGFEVFHKNIYLQGIPTAVATNCDTNFVTIVENEVRLSSFFKTNVYSIDLVENRNKPDPAIYLYAALQLGVNNKRCIAIEDSAAGILAAKKAEMFCIGINTSGNKKNLSQADIIVNTYSEINLNEIFK
jgi:beta-phosphoglucomutase-like phosphatase (HAD superfamily)